MGSLAQVIYLNCVIKKLTSAFYASVFLLVIGST